MELHMNKKIKIKVCNYLTRFFDKCIKNNINLYDVNYVDENSAIMLINLSDYKKIKKLNYYSKITVYDYDGFLKIKNNIYKNKYHYLIFILCFILMDIITSYIVDIEIIHENKSIQKLVKKELENHNVKKYSLAHSFEELEKIKENILKDNKNTLEWMSITRQGMKYIIRIEERIIKNNQKEEGFRHLVANKDAEITKIISNKGEVLVRSGEYVKKGDILISGEIKLYEEVKGNTSASGTVYGNVWYTANINYPKTITKEEYTGKKRYNIIINNKIFLKNKYKYFKQENIKEFKILGLKIKVYKEVEYTKKEIKLNNKENESAAINKIKDEFNIKLKGNGEVTKITLLEKYELDNAVSYSFFVTTNEIISEYAYYEVDNEFEEKDNDINKEEIIN